MFHRLREPFGKAGLIVAVVALVAALTGGAIAANGGSGDGGASASASQKGKKGPRGPRGPQGPQGPAGANGLDGAQGPKGDTGAKGDTGGTGATGATGKSVQVLGSAPGCANGGASVQVEGTPASKQEICDGEKGDEGEPWTPDNVLPPNATETGAFSAAHTRELDFFNTAIEFSIPLEAPLGPLDVGVVNSAGEEYDPGSETFGQPANCLGSVSAPTAPADFLCVYMGAAQNLFAPVPFVQKPETLSAPTEVGTGTSGALLWFVGSSGVTTTNPARAVGTYAVTG